MPSPIAGIKASPAGSVGIIADMGIGTLPQDGLRSTKPVLRRFCQRRAREPGDGKGMSVSVQISPAREAKTARDCRDAEHKHIREHKAFAQAQIRPSEGSEVDLEVRVPLGSDGAVSRHVHRFWLRDGVCAKVHASKTPFAERDQAGFDALLASVRFDPAAELVERAFVIPGRGTLLMTVPALWGFSTSQPNSSDAAQCHVHGASRRLPADADACSRRRENIEGRPDDPRCRGQHA